VRDALDALTHDKMMIVMTSPKFVSTGPGTSPTAAPTAAQSHRRRLHAARDSSDSSSSASSDASPPPKYDASGHITAPASGAALKQAYMGLGGKGFGKSSSPAVDSHSGEQKSSTAAASPPAVNTRRYGAETPAAAPTPFALPYVPFSRASLKGFFERHEPKKQATVDQLMSHYKGKEQMLWKMLLTKYSAAPGVNAWSDAKVGDGTAHHDTHGKKAAKATYPPLTMIEHWFGTHYFKQHFTTQQIAMWARAEQEWVKEIYSTRGTEEMDEKNGETGPKSDWERMEADFEELGEEIEEKLGMGKDSGTKQGAAKPPVGPVVPAPDEHTTSRVRHRHGLIRKVAPNRAHDDAEVPEFVLAPEQLGGALLRLPICPNQYIPSSKNLKLLKSGFHGKASGDAKGAQAEAALEAEAAMMAGGYGTAGAAGVAAGATTSATAQADRRNNGGWKGDVILTKEQQRRLAYHEPLLLVVPGEKGGGGGAEVWWQQGDSMLHEPKVQVRLLLVSSLAYATVEDAGMMEMLISLAKDQVGDLLLQYTCCNTPAAVHLFTHFFVYIARFLLTTSYLYVPTTVLFSRLHPCCVFGAARRAIVPCSRGWLLV
jgi:hypothetical protein